MNRLRRHWLMAGVGLAAAGAGAWWAERRFRPAHLGDTAAVEAAFWSARFESPSGQPLHMADLRGGPVLVNFWATWCPPCVEELPLLNRFHAEQAARGWRVVGLAVDQVEPVRRFLQRLPLGFPVGMTGFAGTDLSRNLGNSGGGLPFTVVFDRAGRLAHRKIGQVTPDDLTRWIAAV